MVYLNVSFGIYALMPQGWIFMIFIVVLECLIVRETLDKTFSNRKIFKTVIASNLISGAVGFIISMALTGGWWLVIWLPWVSDNEVRMDTEFDLLLQYYLVAFLLTIIIELIFNVVLLFKSYKVIKVVLTTLLANVVSYLFGSIVLYSFSFM